MAKKKAISYGPDAALIQGEAQVAQSQFLKETVGATAFGQSLTRALSTSFQELEKRKSIVNAYLDNLKSVDNVRKIDDDYNKKAINDFVLRKKDAYAKAADCFAKTRDRGCKEIMDDINFAFTNLNNQLNVYQRDKKEYLKAFDDGDIVEIPGDEIFPYMYTDKGELSITDDGDLGITIGGKYNKYADVAGRWNTRQFKGETSVLEQSLHQKQRGEKGLPFYKDDVKNTFVTKFNQGGKEGLMVMALSDVTGDNEYILPDGRKAGNLSFEYMWSQGLLDKKFYKEFKAKDGSGWMFDKLNSGKLNDLMSEYYTDVAEYSHGQGSANYKDPNVGRGGRKGNGQNVLGGFKSYEAIDYVANGIMNKRATIESLDNKATWRWDNKKQKYVSGTQELTQQQLMDNQGIAFLYPDFMKQSQSTPTGNINFVNFNNDRDGDGAPNSIDREPDNPNNK